MRFCCPHGGTEVLFSTKPSSEAIRCMNGQSFERSCKHPSDKARLSNCCNFANIGHRETIPAIAGRVIALAAICLVSCLRIQIAPLSRGLKKKVCFHTCAHVCRLFYRVCLLVAMDSIDSIRRAGEVIALACEVCRLIEAAGSSCTSGCNGFTWRRTDWL